MHSTLALFTTLATISTVLVYASPILPKAISSDNVVVPIAPAPRSSLVSSASSGSLDNFSATVEVIKGSVPEEKDLETRQTGPFTTLTTAQIASFKPFSYFAAAGYCDPSDILRWGCGANCKANADFIPTASGGNGGSVQFWFVGYSPSLDTVIISHQGTDPTEFESLLTDADFFLDTLDPTLFPGVPKGVEIHNGFGEAHKDTAQSVLSAVQTTLSRHQTSKVTLVGHSLGGALSLLDSIYLPLHLSTTPGGTKITYKTIVYGVPRVGNPAFADYVDQHVDLTRVNNDNDLIPIVPGRFLGFAHPNGEVHIQDDEKTWVGCPGHDNTSPLCTIGTVPTVFEGNILDHLGPYDGVEMASFTCVEGSEEQAGLGNGEWMELEWNL
ncbi:hypothetical protein D9758_010002 [Tetrapyrgos nigripes]|uniref:Fungal lipase-type domain-containing protein n=1 Tax=Tetrapyrgos nigripes TaxID=182062 RepID=A0A8H5CUE4_9AGAR|nr:hypothetical protein D9758_010002 [Tetrapyrgos nigripes]